MTQNELNGTVAQPAEPAPAPAPEAAPAPTGSQEAVTQETAPTPVAEKPEFDAKDWIAQNQNIPVSDWKMPQEHAEVILEEMRQGNLRQSDYSRKMNEMKAQPTAWDTERLMQEWQKPDFKEAVTQYYHQELEKQQQAQQMEYMTDEQKRVVEVQNQQQQLQTQLQQQQQFLEEQRLQNELKELDQKFNGQVSPMKNEIQELRLGALNPKKGLSPLGAFKALNYDAAIKAAFEQGKQEGMGIKNQRLNNQPITNTVPNVSQGGPAISSFSEASQATRQDMGFG